MIRGLLSFALLFLLTSCGDAPPPSTRDPKASPPPPTQTTQPAPGRPAPGAPAALTAVDYVLLAEDAWRSSDRDGAVKHYGQAIADTEKAGNSAQARIFSARRDEIERAKLK